MFNSIAKRGFGSYSDRAIGNYVDLLMARTTIEAYGFIRRAIEENWVDFVSVGTTGRQRFLASRNIDSVYAPASYNDRCGEERRVARDIDVVFIGKLNKGFRRERLNEVLSALEKRGVRVVVVEGGCWGEARTALLNRTKLVLHLHKYPFDTPWMRWAMAAACGAPVISEPLDNREPFEPGVHYFEAPFDALPDTIEHLISDTEKLSATAHRCLTLVKEKANAHTSLATILSLAFGDGKARASI